MICRKNWMILKIEINLNSVISGAFMKEEEDLGGLPVDYRMILSHQYDSVMKKGIVIDPRIKSVEVFPVETGKC